MIRVTLRFMPIRMSDIPKDKASPSIFAGRDLVASSTHRFEPRLPGGIVSSASSHAPSRTSALEHLGTSFGMGRRTTRLRLSVDQLDFVGFRNVKPDDQRYAVACASEYGAVVILLLSEESRH